MSKFVKITLGLIIAVLLGYSSAALRSNPTPQICKCNSQTYITKYGFPAKYYEKDETFAPSGKLISTKYRVHAEQLIINIFVWFAVSLALIEIIDAVRKRRAPLKQDSNQAALETT